MDIEPKIALDLRFSRSSASMTWGKRIIRAIDNDDVMACVKVFQSREDAIEGADINAVVNDYGYGGYVWTVNMMPFVGDTALNIAIKLKKLKCIWGLLLLNSDVNIRNQSGLNANDLAVEKFSRDIGSYKYEALEMLMEHLDPRRFDELPDVFILRGVGTEGWNLMNHGRSTYVELPNCLLPDRDKIVVPGVNDNDGVVYGANIGITDNFCVNGISDVTKTIKRQQQRFLKQERIDMEKFKAAEIHAAIRKLGFRRKGEEASKITESAPEEDEDDVPDVGKDEL